ncbi:hypothetical protein Y1Q_0017451 [Alligator mississippiensis]|uniref:Uncharacterized protein n=1 Tax=Alligator mississippiensis TaxID=8496 RepID=A0A151P252_ALLMI|nr:hypothetical protein Y1Q_0017451 [Alligator mississippiensis]
MEFIWGSMKSVLEREEIVSSKPRLKRCHGLPMHYQVDHALKQTPKDGSEVHWSVVPRITSEALSEEKEERGITDTWKPVINVYILKRRRTRSQTTSL